MLIKTIRGRCPICLGYKFWSDTAGQNLICQRSGHRLTVDQLIQNEIMIPTGYSYVQAGDCSAREESDLTGITDPVRLAKEKEYNRTLVKHDFMSKGFKKMLEARFNIPLSELWGGDQS